MARSASPLLVLVFAILILNSMVMVVRAPVKADSGQMSTDKSDYFIGERVQANFVIEWTGGSAPPLPMTFEWYTPANVTIFNETTDGISYQIGNTKYIGAYSNWTSDMNGTGFRVKGIHNDSGESDESYFNVWDYGEAAYVEDLTLSLNSKFYENNTAAVGTATLGYLGNGTKLGNVTFDWRYPNSTVAFSENVSAPDGGLNGTVEVNSTWAIDFVGMGFEVQARYNGVQPLTDIAFFDVIPERVRTWKNASISGNEIWTKSESPIGICANITVQQGATLTVEAGSVIRFCPDAGMTVRGTLVMDGLATSPINLTSYSYPSNPGDWKGLAFEDESSDVGSILSHVEVGFSQIGVGFNRASPAIVNVSISNSSTSGMEAYWTDILLTSISIIDCGRGIYASHTTLNLMDSEILRCNDGVVLEDSNGTLENNYIHHNVERGIWVVRSSPVISESFIIRNANKGIRIEESQNFLITNSTISWSNFTFDSFQSVGLTLRESYFSNGSAVGLSFWTTDGVLVENSTIENAPTSLRVAGGSTVRTLNCTFDGSTVFVTGGSRLYVDNFLHIRAIDDVGSPLEGASITLSLDDVPSVIGSTGADGWFKWHIIRHAVYSGLPGDPDVTWVFLGLDLDDYNFTDSSRNVNMATSHTEVFVGQPIPSNGDGDGFDAIQLVIRILVGGIIGAVLATIAVVLMKRRKKKAEDEVPEFDIEDGKAYIVTQDGDGRTFDRLVSELNEGSKGLCFTRTYPKSLLKQYDLEDANVAWLSRDIDKGGLMPTNLGLITSEVDKFLGANEGNRRIILLEGLEYLIAQNGFSKVLKLLNHLKDTMGVRGGAMLIPFDMKSVDEKQEAMLRADLEIV